ncbi:acyltransferase [Clostridium sp.]|uniref:acyltransferase n=1 Tax=Clostridium sp. TaxID=1506 RepID=UPI00284D7245|nr:acyltransferase [Clostridium sp.]MDR3597525.1 acyltransferase [Clostridium sp.]
MSSFYSQDELNKIGFKSLGKNVLISKKCSIYSPEHIEIRSNVRIDDFCILSGKIKIGGNIHISAYTALYGKNGIILEDYVTISGRNLIYSASDDYSGEYMTNPMNSKYTNVTGGSVILCKHTIVGAGCILLPNITLKEGTAIGAMSLVNKSTEEWGMYVGIPAKKIKNRSRTLLKYEEANS